MEKQICLSLVYQHLLHASPGLAIDFDDEYKPEKALVKAEDVLVRWEEEQVARLLVYNHLKAVVPALAKEFKDTRYVSEDVCGENEAMLNIKDVLAQLARGHLERVALDLAEEFKDAYPCVSSMVPVKLSLISNGRLGEKQARFTDEQVKRLSRAIKENENITTVAQEMGRTYKSVKN